MLQATQVMQEQQQQKQLQVSTQPQGFRSVVFIFWIRLLVACCEILYFISGKQPLLQLRETYIPSLQI